MCGIFGGSAHEGEKLKDWKLRLLGVYNAERGVDSCGYYFNGNIKKGVLNEANIKRFIAVNKFERGDLDIEGDVFIGHTRKSTSGSNNLLNAHPHEVNDYVQVHNGIIYNIDSMLHKHGIWDYHPVDSQGLATLIESKGFGILNNYIGYAALVMTFQNDPEYVYMYHGESRDSKNGPLIKERPLYVLHQPEGTYFSSIDDSLRAINETDAAVLVLKYNCVYRLKYGEFDNDFAFPIQREDTNIFEFKSKSETKSNSGALSIWKGNVDKRLNRPNKNTEIVKHDPNLDDMIKYEQIPVQSMTMGAVYYNQSRYWLGKELMDGVYEIGRDGYIRSNDSKSFWEVFYFIKGIMMKSLDDYEQAKAQLPIGNYLNVAFLLSRYSKYPVFSLPNEALNALAMDKNRWYHNDEPVLDKFTFEPKFSDKRYSIRGGKTEAVFSRVGNFIKTL